MTLALSPTKLNQIRAQLLTERQRLLKSEKQFVKSDLDRLDIKSGPPNNLDEASDPESLVAEIALEEHVLNAIASIDLALDRIETQRYGICADCGKPIPDDRLEAFPAAARCLECKKVFEVKTQK